jgi:hypothetical protein
MRILNFSILLAALMQVSALGASFREEQITAKELADELGFDTRKLIFVFDSPIYARADFVRVDSGRAIHLPIVAPTPRSEIPFSYILRNVDMNTKSITFEIGGARFNNTFKYLPNPSARVHDFYPDISLPPQLASQKPIYIFLVWDPNIDRVLTRRMPPDELASKMKQGFYLALYFSDAPFSK